MHARLDETRGCCAARRQRALPRHPADVIQAHDFRIQMAGLGLDARTLVQCDDIGARGPRVLRPPRRCCMPSAVCHPKPESPGPSGLRGCQSSAAGPSVQVKEARNAAQDLRTPARRLAEATHAPRRPKGAGASRADDLRLRARSSPRAAPWVIRLPAQCDRESVGHPLKRGVSTRAPETVPSDEARERRPHKDALPESDRSRSSRQGRHHLAVSRGPSSSHRYWG
jgi:hypothetical protein